MNIYVSHRHNDPQKSYKVSLATGCFVLFILLALLAMQSDLRAAANAASTRRLSASHYGRLLYQESPNFTLVVLSDTQYYTWQPIGDGRAMFEAQTQWIVDNQSTRNIVFVTHLGDIVDIYNLNSQWEVAGSLADPIGALTRLDNAGIPYSLAVGNHDTGPEGTQDFNRYFGESRFAGRSYYGGHYGSDNDNSYDLFNSGSLDFIVINLGYTTSLDPNVLAWANDLLAAQYPTRRAIVVYHNLLRENSIPAPFSDEGQAIYDTLKGNANLFLMLGGHLPTEVSRTDTFDGHTVYSLRSDYQDREMGDGWLRLMEFQPAANQIQVYTYSPYLDQWETDADSQFTLPYDMSSVLYPPSTPTQSATAVPPDPSPEVTLAGVSTSTEYVENVTISESTPTVTGLVGSFPPEGTMVVEPVSQGTPAVTGLVASITPEGTMVVEPVSADPGPRSNAFLIPCLIVVEISGLAIIFIVIRLFRKRR